MCTDTTANAVATLLTRKAKTGQRVAKLDAFQIAEAVGSTPASIRDVLAELADDGVVRNVHEGAEWQVLKPHVCPVQTATFTNDLTRLAGREYTGGAGVRTPSQGLSALGSGGMEESVSSLILGDDDLPRLLSSAWPELPKASRIESIDPAKWNSRDLAYYFRQQVRDAISEHRMVVGPGLVNIDALSGNFRQWMKTDGLTSVQIKSMIDYFARHIEGHLPKGKSPWKMFLNQRTGLYQRMVEHAENEARKSLSPEERQALYEKAPAHKDRSHEYEMGAW